MIEKIDNIREALNDLEIELTAVNQNEDEVFKLWMIFYDKCYELGKETGFYEVSEF